MKISLAFGSDTRRVGKFPPITQTNMLAEKTSTQLESPIALIPRPGLTAFATVGDGPIRHMNRKSGLFNEAAVVVSREKVFLLSANAIATQQTGTLSTTAGHVQIAMGRDSNGDSLARIADGARLYLVSGGTVTAENFPSAIETAGADSVAYLRQFWFAVKSGTAQVYYLVPGDTVWNALDFATAEYQPDPIICIAVLGEQIFLLGAASTEVWALTGSTSPALAPYGGLAWNIGCLSRDSAVNVRDSLIWVTDTCDVVQTFGSTPQVISTPGISEQIRQSDADQIDAWSFIMDQHMYYVLTLSTQTWIYDMTTQLWSRADSVGYDFWRAGIGCAVAGQAYAADILPGSAMVWTVDPDSLTDDGDGISRVCTGFFEMRDGKLACGNVSIVCSAGQGNIIDPGANPVVQMRYSDSYGQTWSEWKNAELGKAGEFEYRVRWNRLGLLRSPGRYFQFRTSDPVIFRMTDIRMNEVL